MIFDYLFLVKQKEDDYSKNVQKFEYWKKDFSWERTEGSKDTIDIGQLYLLEALFGSIVAWMLLLLLSK